MRSKRSNGIELDVIRERIQLPTPRAGKKREVDTNTMHDLPFARKANGTMQHAASLKPKLGDIHILRLFDRKASKDGIPMMPVTIHHVAAISRGLPNVFRQEFML